ncbi:hypothetical protein BGZ76_004467, partial [Entomortierella beljakovae]
SSNSKSASKSKNAKTKAKAKAKAKSKSKSNSKSKSKSKSNGKVKANAKSNKRFEKKDIEIILGWLEHPPNFNSVFGGQETGVGKPHKPASHGYRLLASFLKRQSKGLLDLTHKAMKDRFHQHFKRYKATKEASEKTGFGVTQDDVDSGIYTIEQKLESMCHCCERMDTLFGERPNVTPLYYHLAGTPKEAQENANKITHCRRLIVEEEDEEAEEVAHPIDSEGPVSLRSMKAVDAVDVVESVDAVDVVDAMDAVDAVDVDVAIVTSWVDNVTSNDTANDDLLETGYQTVFQNNFEEIDEVMELENIISPSQRKRQLVQDDREKERLNLEASKWEKEAKYQAIKIDIEKEKVENEKEYQKQKVDMEIQRMNKDIEHQSEIVDLEKQKLEIERLRLEAELSGNSPMVQAGKLKFATSAVEKGMSLQEIESFVDRLLKKK